MSLFACECCGVVENTALCNYWLSKDKTEGQALCSQCDPNIGKWHGIFPREDAFEAGYVKIPNSNFIELASSRRQQA